jgi:hypothetical protein
MIIKEFEPVKYSDFERQKIPAKNNFIQTFLSKNLMEALRLHQIGQHLSSLFKVFECSEETMKIWRNSATFYYSLQHVIAYYFGTKLGEYSDQPIAYYFGTTHKTKES